MRKKIFIVMVACALIWGACDSDKGFDGYPVITDEIPEGYDGYKSVWADEFITDGLSDNAFWECKKDLSLDEETQDYRVNDPKCARVENGILILEAYEDPHEGIDITGAPYFYDYSSAFVVSKQNVQRGRIDVAVKVPIGRGIHPTIRLVPVDNTDAEITLVDYVFGGNPDNPTNYPAIHTPAARKAGVAAASAAKVSRTLEDRYHLYSVVWGKKKIELLFDNEIILTYNKTKNNDDTVWPFDRDFRLEMKVAVGGEWGGTWGIDKRIFPKKMPVEYVRYYQLIDDNEDGWVDDGEITDDDKIEFVNGDFEESFTMGKAPAIIDAQLTKGANILNYTHCWFAPFADNKKSTLTVDKTVGYESTSSMKWEYQQTERDASLSEADDINVLKPWNLHIAYSIEKVPAGIYNLSFYTKSNWEEGATLSVALAICEDEADLSARDATREQVLVPKDGNWLKTAPDYWNKGGCSSSYRDRSVKEEWKKVTIENIEIPDNMLMNFIMMPCVGNNDDLSNHYLEGKFKTGTRKIIFWFDKFKLEPVMEEIE